MDSRLIGGILLIIGTSIGGGMLALPISNSTIGFFGSTLLLIAAWIIMTVGALAILEVNLWFASGSNLPSMAQNTLGKTGKIITWIAYLFLLYALLSAYISGGSDVFQALFHQIGIFMPDWLSTLVFVFIFGSIVYSGIRAVDYTNRALMFGKIGVCLLLLLFILPRINLFNLFSGQWEYTGSAIMLSMTSFGFASIVPSLRTYFNDDAIKLRKAIIIGSFVPLIAYIAWDAAIMGVISLEGEQGLLALLKSKHSTSELTLSLTSVTQSTWITYFFRFFTSICMLTAFLGVSLGLFDFLADGLNKTKKGLSGLFIGTLAYLPPLLIVLFYPGIFISALSYAGVFCVILLLLMPALMLWSGRYIKNIASAHAANTVSAQVNTNTNANGSITLVKGGRTVLILIYMISLFLIYLAIP